MNNRQVILISLALFAVLLSHQPELQAKTASPVRQTTSAAGSNQPQAIPPRPPIHENFDGRPQLSLFPRLGDFKPEEFDQNRLPYWRSYLAHLQKVTGVTSKEAGGGNQSFAFRTIKGISSVGYFSPLAVEPNTVYKVAAQIKVELPKGGSAGIGVIGFDQFLWRGEQFTQTLDNKHRTETHAGVKLTESCDWTEQMFTFTTGPDTKMVHLVLFREGTANRKPMLLDDISIEKVK